MVYETPKSSPRPVLYHTLKTMTPWDAQRLERSQRMNAAFSETSSSTVVTTPLVKKQYHYYSPSHARFEDAAEKARAPKTIEEEELSESPVIQVRRTRVQKLDMKKQISVENRLQQNEHYRTEVETRLRQQMRKQELERMKKFKSNYTSYSTSFARSSNTSSMAYNRNKPKNTVRVIRRLRQERKLENINLTQGMRRDMQKNLDDAKEQLKESKLKTAETQRKIDMDNEHYVAEARIKSREDVINTVQGQKMVHDVLSSLVRSDMMFAQRFQNKNNMLYSQVRQQRQKMSRKQDVKHNKERVAVHCARSKAAHDRAKAMLESRMNKVKRETERQQDQITAVLKDRKEVLRRRDLKIKARMKRDYDTHQCLNPDAFITIGEKNRERRIPWAGATSRRMDVYIEQTNKRLLPLTQVVSAKEAVEDDPDFYDASEMM